MGVGFCVLFAVWFVSGIVLMYWDFPRWSAAKRLAGMEALNAGQIRLTPTDAFSRLDASEAPQRVRITMLDGRPVYRFHYGTRQRLVHADDGSPPTPVDEAVGRRLSAAWLDRPADQATFDGPLDVDQWTVHPSVRPYGPFLKYSWDDGHEVYVAEPSGEVVQQTTSAERLGAWLGAIPHWLYFTPIRADPRLWNAVVTWASGIGTAMAAVGLIVGLWLYSPVRKPYRFAGAQSSVPYAGQKRWHTMLGLVFGLSVCTWSLSGMMSMSPVAWLRTPAPTNLAAILPGAVWSPEAFSEHPRDLLTRLAGMLTVKEVELAFVGGRPLYLAVESPDRSLTITPGEPPQPLLDAELLARSIATAVRPETLAETRVVEEYEPYYVDREFRHGYSLPALFVRLDDAEGSMHYIDLRTGKVAKSYGAGLRWNRWLYNGLHSFDLPTLYRYRPLWDVVMLTLMVGGTALCVTSLVIGWRRVRRTIAMRRSHRLSTLWKDVDPGIPGGEAARAESARLP